MANKYHNVVTERDGRKFSSRAEAQRYSELSLLETAGVITNLCTQPRFELQPSFRDRAGIHHRAIDYLGDFSYIDAESGVHVVEDVKGKATAVFLIKQKMFLLRFPDLDLRVLKAGGR